jgi:hypothetical protein
VVSSSGTLNGAGSVYLFASPLTSSMSTDDASVALHGSAIADAFGRAVSGGDFDGDESPDVAVGAPLDDTPASAAGSMYLWYGSLTAGSYSATTADLVVTGTAASDSFGADLAFLGDTDGNGADDLVIGASGYDASGSSTNYGGAFLLLGGGM